MSEKSRLGPSRVEGTEGIAKEKTVVGAFGRELYHREPR